MNGIYYNQAEKNICFTQGYGEERYHEPEWNLLWTGRTQGNINTSIFCTDAISLFLFNASACMYEWMIKKELKEQGEFEFYYGEKETEGCYDLINLVQLLFWGIQARDNENNISWKGLTMNQYIGTVLLFDGQLVLHYFLIKDGRAMSGSKKVDGIVNDIDMVMFDSENL